MNASIFMAASLEYFARPWSFIKGGSHRFPAAVPKNEIKRQKNEEEGSRGRKLEIHVLKPENVSCLLLEK